MAHYNKESTQTQQQRSSQSQTNSTKKAAPMIVQRVNKIPVVKMAVTMGFTQYDKLKSSNVTVGELITRAENIAAYFWSKVQPIVDKFQGPISKADQLACSSLDFVEGKLNAVKVQHK